MKKKPNDTLVTKTLTSDVPFAIREAFNQLRTNLMYTITDDTEGAPVFAITSTTENSGKSTIIANLAISFSQLNKKVLLIDGDMRCPVIHDYFGLDDKQQGLSDCISGITHDVIIRDAKKNLDVITSGRIPPNPSELLASPRFVACLEDWKKEYDIIFIDFPPIGIVSDSVANYKSITGYIFAIRSGNSTAKKINSAIESMERLGAKIVGVVLNDCNIKGTGYYRNGSGYTKYEGNYSNASKNSDKSSAEKADGKKK